MPLIDPFWYPTLVAAAIAVVVASLVQRAVEVLLLRLTKSLPISQATLVAMRQPARWTLPLVALQMTAQGAPNTLPGIEPLRHGLMIALIAAFTWLLVRAVTGLARGVIAKYPADADENLRARRLHTQARVLARTVNGIIIVAGLSMILMSFPGARRIGTSLLASAGLIGIVAGLAAKPVFSNLIAGLQIALAQPIRIDDVLVVEGQWGRVEEISGTVVVVRLWDERRLILPLTYFIERPFENWTRRSSQLHGSVFLQVDYRTPLAPLRAELERIVRSAPEWDGRYFDLKVTDANDRTMQVRVLCTAHSSSLAFDLRCRVRESLIEFLQREYPDCLPRMRIDAPPDAGWESADGQRRQAWRDGRKDGRALADGRVEESPSGVIDHGQGVLASRPPDPTSGARPSSPLG